MPPLAFASLQEAYMQTLDEWEQWIRDFKEEARRQSDFMSPPRSAHRGSQASLRAG